MLVNEYLKIVPNPLGNGFSYEPFNDNEFLLNLKNYVSFNHGSLQIRPTLEENIDYIPNMVLNMIECKKYQYNKLWKSTLLNYEPLENYRMEESGTDTSIENTTSNIGEQTNNSNDTKTINIGEQTNNGNDTKTTNIGEIHSKNSNSVVYSGKETTSEFVSPYDDTNATLSKKTENEYTDRIDDTTATNTTDARQDSETQSSNVTVGAREDSETQSSNVTVGARKDTSANDSTTNHTFTRSGNIGVTTSQQMLQSEREIAYFNFISIVAHDIVKIIAICIY